jgi:hypothetical protein
VVLSSVFKVASLTMISIRGFLPERPGAGPGSLLALGIWGALELGRCSQEAPPSEWGKRSGLGS